MPVWPDWASLRPPNPRGPHAWPLRESETEAVMKKGTNKRNRNKSSRNRAKLKAKHRRARKRVSPDGRKYHR